MRYNPYIAFVATVAVTLSSCDSGSNSSKDDADVVPDTSGPVLAPVDTVAAPVFSLSGGTFTAAQTVTLSTKTLGASIFYTTDGTVPTTASTEYVSPVSVGKTQTLKAIAVKTGMVTSPVRTESYTISASVSNWGIPWNKSITYGSLTDSRDGSVYRTVEIGQQTWMAENLNYRGSGVDTVGVCYGNRTDSCSKYGRLYRWLEVMDGSSSSDGVPSNVKGLCPAGWHVPSDSEWIAMENHVGAPAGTKLKSSKGWNRSNNGTDAYGFRALPAGHRDDGCYNSGAEGSWWTATANGSTPFVWNHAMSADTTVVYRFDGARSPGYSLRCVQD